MKVLLTNGSGFVAGHLIPGLREAGFEVSAWTLPGQSVAGVPTSPVDITDLSQVSDQLAVTEPDAIVHLAAISHVPTSFREPDLTWRVNVMGSLNLMTAVSEQCKDSRLLMIGSSDSYGESFASGEPVNERTLLRPLNPYAASKAAADMMAFQYARSHQLNILRLRPFNHIGPGQSADFVVSTFARQIAQIETGVNPPELLVGNLDATRDFLDVRDVVRAYIALLEQPQSVYNGQALNICSGRQTKIADIVRHLIAQSDHDISVVHDPERMRPSDIPAACGSNQAITGLTGWTPTMPWESTLKDVLDYWRRTP